MAARFYLDHHVNVELATRLEASGHDVLKTFDANMDTAEDEEQLEFATKELRILYTQNIQHFKVIAERWGRQDREHAGLMYSSQQRAALLHQWIEAALDLYPDGIHNVTLSLPVATH